jgi:hypothetical protein
MLQFPRCLQTQRKYVLPEHSRLEMHSECFAPPFTFSLMFCAGWINKASRDIGAILLRTQIKGTRVCAPVLLQMCCAMFVATLQWEGFTGCALNTQMWVLVKIILLTGISLWQNKTDKIKRIVYWLVFSLFKSLLANILSQRWLAVLPKWLYHVSEMIWHSYVVLLSFFGKMMLSITRCIPEKINNWDIFCNHSAMTMILCYLNEVVKADYHLRKSSKS